MPPTSHSLKGIPLDDIDAIAQEILNLLQESEVRKDLASYALCRAVVAVDFDLDEACRVIDDLSTMEDLPPLTYSGGEHDDYTSRED